MKRKLQILLGLLMLLAPFFFGALAFNGGHVKPALLSFALCIGAAAALCGGVGIMLCGLHLVFGD